MLRNATFRQLSAFHAVARLGSVSRAAAELNLTQPAISTQLKLLNESAGVPLLRRVGRGVQLTPAGEVMAGYARRILDLWREVGAEMSTFRGAASGTLRVGAVTTAEYLVPSLLVGFASDHPRVRLQLRVGNRDEIVHMLAAHEVDCVIMGRPPGELKTQSFAFAKHPMGFIASATHPLMAVPRLTLSDLPAANLLARERGSGTRTTLERLFKESGVALRLGAELSSNEAIKQMCLAGLGVAFLSLHTCRLEIEAGLLKLLPLPDNPIEREWFAIHLTSRPMPQAVLAFERFLLERGQQHILERLALPAAASAPRRRGPAARQALR